MITIYVFSDEDCFPVYIGKAKDLIKRIKQHLNYDRYRYKSWFYNWLNKQIKEDKEFYIDILEICTEEDWQEREKYWIKHVKELGYNITNMTDGGDGNNNQVFSKESNQKRADKLKGRYCSLETREKIAKKHEGKIVKESTKQKLREINLGKKCPKHVKEGFQKKVKQYNENGTLVKEWESLTEASEWLKCRKSTLSNIITRKKSKEFKGFVWKYK